MKYLKKIKSLLASFLTIILLAPMISSSCSANDENLINDNVDDINWLTWLCEEGYINILYP